MIKDFSDLKKLLKMCREQGVTEITMPEISFKLGDAPVTHNNFSREDEQSVTNPYANFPQGELTPEQLMFYSSGGLPSDDPALKGGAN